ncbi:MAG: hypothetical protein ACKVOT_05745 [Polaromonas sp.]
MQSMARAALARTGLCDESDSVLRFSRDHKTGHLIVMVYLAHFDHAAWTMSRHIESYLMRQFKGLYGVSVHSVHIDVVRSRAFKETPAFKSADALGAELRERRFTGVKPTGITGKKIGRDERYTSDDDSFIPTGQMGLDSGEARGNANGPPSRHQQLEQRRNQAVDKIRYSLGTDEYLSVPGYEVSDVDFEQFLSSLPPDSLPAAPDRPALSANAPGAAFRPAVKPPQGFVAEADLMKRERP